MMKKSCFMLLVAATLLTVTTIRAQETFPGENPAPQQQHKTPEQLAAMQARHIASELAFDEEVARQFTETYCQYHKELRALRSERPRVKDADEQTEEAIRQSILAQFDQSRKMLDLREKCYTEYSRFLTQRQIRRVYELEREVNQRLSKTRRQGRNLSQNQNPSQSRNLSQNRKLNRKLNRARHQLADKLNQARLQLEGKR